jgi:hypothetical protein
VIVIDPLSDPPVPVHVSVYVEVAERGPTCCDPLVALVPVHAPPAVQLVEFVLLQVSVEVPPLATVVGLALSETTGAGATVTEALFATEPPAPPQVSV